MNISNWLHQQAKLNPQRVAIRFGEDVHATYGQFAQRSMTMGQTLVKSHGITQGDRVALFCQNCPQYLEVMHAVLGIGAVIVPINHKLHPAEAAWIVQDADASLVVTDSGVVFDAPKTPVISCPEINITSENLRRASEVRHHEPTTVLDDDIAWLFYTSGTTGRPKGVMLTHKNLRMMAASYALDVDSINASDNALYAAPMSHGAGLYNFQFLRAGACHVIPKSKGFDPDEISALGQSLGELVFFAAPTMIKRMVAHARQSGHGSEGIRTIIYGGGPMYLADINEALEVFGPKFVQIYGQGESPMTITVLPRDQVAADPSPQTAHRRMSVGYAQSCIELRVVDDDQKDLEPGQVGEIILRGDTVMKGYWRNETATAETIVDGWLHTGDMGSLSADGFLTITDRSKDMIISGGSNIYPREVEEILAQHPDIFEVSVIGQPDPEWGEIVVAFVVCHPDRTCQPATLDDWCKAHIASFKKPKLYVFMQELPKNSYGKILKTELRKSSAAPI